MLVHSGARSELWRWCHTSHLRRSGTHRRTALCRYGTAPSTHIRQAFVWRTPHVLPACMHIACRACYDVADQLVGRHCQNFNMASLIGQSCIWAMACCCRCYQYQCALSGAYEHMHVCKHGKHWQALAVSLFHSPNFLACMYIHACTSAPHSRVLTRFFPGTNVSNH